MPGYLGGQHLYRTGAGSVQIQGAELPQKFRAVTPGLYLDFSTDSMCCDDLPAFQIFLRHKALL